MFCTRSVGRGGVTLVEMMIAMIITLMIVFAMVQAFARIGETTADGRAVIEMQGQMRQTRFIFEEDISRCTIPVAMRDPAGYLPDQHHGGFELIEGMGSDSVPGRFFVRTPNAGVKYGLFNFANPNDALAAQSQTLFGDLDDILWMTIRNDEVPFRGRLAVGAGADGVWNTTDDVINTIESNLAEVIWWAELNDQPQDVDGDGLIAPPQDNNNDGVIDVAGEGGYGEWNPGETFTIRRRILLIRPDLTVNTNGFMSNPPVPLDEQRAFLFSNDVSVHFHYDETTHAPMGLRANSLGDLTFRWNRSIHQPIDFSVVDSSGNPMGLSTGGYIGPIHPGYLPAYQSASLRGEDVVLSNVTAFDFRVWDPNVQVCGYPTLNGELPEGLVPGDPGYDVNAVQTNTQGFGGFIDLGCVDQSANLPLFAAMQRNRPGVDDDGDGLIDEADENNLNPQFIDRVNLRSTLRTGTSNIGYVYDPWTLRYESDTYNEDFPIDGDTVSDDGGETEPPYTHPLKALQVRIRMYESDTRQVKQLSQNIEFAK
jgi:hypothetical protein